MNNCDGNCGGHGLLDQIEFSRRILRLIWCRDSAKPSCQEAWRGMNPAYGQDDVTALVVQSLFGGDILRADESGRAPRFYNCLPEGEMIDLTREKYWVGQEFAPLSVCPRESALGSPDAVAAGTAERYDRLWASFVAMARETAAESSL